MLRVRIAIATALLLTACPRPPAAGSTAPSPEVSPATTEATPATAPTEPVAATEPPAAVPPPSHEVLTRAKDHFMRAVAAYGHGDFAEALVQYGNADMLTPRAAIRVDMARCHLRMGDRAAARREIDGVLSRSSLDDDTRADALALSAEIDAAP
jgi:predicted lipid-binding transport protein (Tim44 family)